MVLLRRVIGDALRARRQRQHRTLREVSTAANVSLGYLSEIERGQKEASSELLAAICDALGAQLSELLRDVSHTVALAEQMQGVLMPVRDDRTAAVQPATRPVASSAPVRSATRQATRPVTPPASVRPGAPDGEIAVAVRHESPLRATLRATRNGRGGPAASGGVNSRDVVCAA